MIKVICVLTLLVLAVGAVFYRSFAYPPFAFGAVLGAALNILKVIMLKHTVMKLSSIEVENARNYASIQSLLRFLLTGAVLVLSAVLPFLDIWGAATGIFIFQIAAYSMKRYTGREEEAKQEAR
jgi:hypothetical protein